MRVGLVDCLLLVPFLRTKEIETPPRRGADTPRIDQTFRFDDEFINCLNALTPFRPVFFVVRNSFETFQKN